jgi:hypothetical protein
MYYRTSLYDPTLSDASVDPASEVRSSAMLVLPFVGSYKVRFRAAYNGIKPIPNSIQVRASVLELNHTNGRTDIHDQPYMR